VTKQQWRIPNLPSNERKQTVCCKLSRFCREEDQRKPPPRIINFIPGNSASVNLRQAARQALVAKLGKYDRTENFSEDFSSLYSEPLLPKPLNTNVEKVLQYLRPFLAQAGVNL
jgi:hypothetical protein